MDTNSQFTFMDLFAGIGGIRLAFESVGCRCVFSSEWDKFAIQTYQENFGDIPAGDITKIPSQNIPYADILTAGFPCQPFSSIGKREGFAHETQGTLFYEILRILEDKRPLAFLLENVEGLITHDEGNTFSIMIKELQNQSYKIFYHVLDSQYFNVPQRRKRLFIVGFYERFFPTLDSFFIEQYTEPTAHIKDILEHGINGYSITERLQQGYLFKKDDNRPEIVDQKTLGSVKPLVASYHKIQRLTGTFVRDGETGLRLFSENECKALMGFPEDFQFSVSRTQMYRQLGNSVVVPVVQEIAKSMLRVFSEFATV